MRQTVTTRKLIVSEIYKTYITPGTKGAVISMTDSDRIVQFEGCPGLYRVPFGSDLVRVDDQIITPKRSTWHTKIRGLVSRLRPASWGRRAA